MQDVYPVARQVVHQIGVLEVPVTGNVPVLGSDQLHLDPSPDGFQQLFIQLLEWVVVRTDDLYTFLRRPDLLHDELVMRDYSLNARVIGLESRDDVP